MTFAFVSRVVYGLVATATIHISALGQQVLPRFEPNSWRGFGIGRAESYLCVAYTERVCIRVYKSLHSTWAKR